MDSPDKPVSLRSEEEPVYYGYSELDLNYDPTIAQTKYEWRQMSGAVVCAHGMSRWQRIKRAVVWFFRPSLKQRAKQRELEIIKLLEARIAAAEARLFYGD